MKVKRGLDGGLYAVFKSNVEADRMSWLYSKLLRRQTACFGQYDNAYRII